MTIEAGTRLGPYEITGTLGAGGMGRVYRARDLRLDRDVAIKLLIADDGADTSDRLLREARNASALNHPNICTLHEISDAGGRPFIVMELVEGEPLDRRIGVSGLPEQDVLKLGAQTADGLAHAHARGVVHRDLKCANVAVTREGRAKILDFGIARRASTAELTDATRSVSALVDDGLAGTLPYMAPELLEGRQADARSDLWALGVMLSEMASGVRPFRGETGLTLSTAILRDPPQIPTAIPAPLGTLIRRLLQKNPDDRIGSAAEVSAELERLATLPAVTAPQANRPRHVVAFATVAALVIAIGGGWWLTRSDAGTLPAIDAIAVLPLENLSGRPDEQYFADGMTEALISHLSAFDNLAVISRTSMMQFKNTTVPLRQIAEQLNVDGIVEGTVLRDGDRVRITARLIDARTERPIWGHEFEEALGDVIGLQRQIAATIGREIQGELSPADTRRLTRRTDVNSEAFQAYLRGRFHWNQRSTSDLLRAEQFFTDAIRLDPGFALAHAGLAEVYVLLGDFRDMLPADAYSRAQDAADAALRLDPELAEAHTIRAWLAFAVRRDWNAAERDFARALELNPGYATAHQWRGEFLAALGRFDESMVSLQRAMELDPLALMPQAVHGWIAYLAGQYNEAIASCEAVLARDPAFRPARMYRAWTYLDQGRLDDAEQEMNALLQISASPAVPTATLGRIHARRGDGERARAAIAKLRALPYPPSFDIAKVYAELRERGPALEWLRKAETERNSAVLFVNVDRAFSWLRGDPEFDALLSRLNLDAPPGD